MRYHFYLLLSPPFLPFACALLFSFFGALSLLVDQSNSVKHLAEMFFACLCGNKMRTPSKALLCSAIRVPLDITEEKKY